MFPISIDAISKRKKGNFIYFFKIKFVKKVEMTNFQSQIE